MKKKARNTPSEEGKSKRLATQDSGFVRAPGSLPYVLGRQPAQAILSLNRVVTVGSVNFKKAVESFQSELGLDRETATRLRVAMSVLMVESNKLAASIRPPAGMTVQEYALSLPTPGPTTEYANYVADSLKKPDLSLAYLYLTLNKASRLAGEGKFVLAFECTTYAIGLLIAAVTLKERIQTTKRVVAGEAKVRSARASKAAAEAMLPIMLDSKKPNVSIAQSHGDSSRTPSKS